MKKCFKCLKTKNINDFYRHSQMLDGHLNKCKACSRLDAVINRNKKIEYYREFDRARAMTPKRIKLRNNYKKSEAGKRVISRLSREWRLRNPEKYSAHIKVGNAIRCGLLLKKPCDICGEVRSHAHHEDYQKPLAVRWLCSAHHRAEHDRSVS